MAHEGVVTRDRNISVAFVKTLCRTLAILSAKPSCKKDFKKQNAKASGHSSRIIFRNHLYFGPNSKSWKVFPTDHSGEQKYMFSAC
jgi:hypothetical protein